MAAPSARSRSTESVVLGPITREVRLDVGVCVKTGATTDERVVMRGSTRPGWVDVLVVVSVIGWIIAAANTSRGYRIELPFLHARHDRWRRLRALCWALGALGVVLAATLARGEFLVLAVAAVVGGLVNAQVNSVGMRQNRAGELMLVRVHPAAAAAIRATQVVVHPVSR